MIGQINKIGQNFDKVNATIDNLESKFKGRIDKFDFYFIQSEETVEKLHKSIEFFENFKTSRKNTQLTKESYDKCMNVIIYEIKEDGDIVWEKREQTI